MAALTRNTTASYIVHENVKVDTMDNEDHTFCGIMFPIKAKKDLPISKLIISSVAVRGELGPLTVWVTKDNDADDNTHAGPASIVNNAAQHHQQRNANNINNGAYSFRMRKRDWVKIYEQQHAPSRRVYKTLDLSANPIFIKPGQVRCLYIHSSTPSDEAIVYDNSPHFLRQQAQQRRPTPRYEDRFLEVHSGRAHLSTVPFGQQPIWGWGNAWRERREFVGQINYGAEYNLWQPTVDCVLHKFGGRFGQAARTLLLCQRRYESPISLLPDECMYYILHLCRWDWFNDNAQDMKSRRRRLRRIKRDQQQQQEQAQEVTPAAQPPAAAAVVTAAPPTKDPSSSLCARVCPSVAAAAATTTNASQGPGAARKVSNDDDQQASDDDDYLSAQEDHAMEDDDSDYLPLSVGRDLVQQAIHGEDEDVLPQDDTDEDEEMQDSEEEEEEEDSDDDDDEDDDDDSDADGWERSHGYRANHNVFQFQDFDSEDEEDNNGNDEAEWLPPGGGNAWFRGHLAHIHVLQRLAMQGQEEG